MTKGRNRTNPPQVATAPRADSAEPRGRLLRFSRRIRRPPTREARIRLATRVILAAGFAAAVVIYLTARPLADNPLGYDPLQNKAYVHELELYGGKYNVIMAEFREWFDGLWRGKQLGITVAVLTLLAAYLFNIGARLLQPDLENADTQD